MQGVFALPSTLASRAAEGGGAVLTQTASPPTSNKITIGSAIHSHDLAPVRPRFRLAPGRDMEVELE